MKSKTNSKVAQTSMRTIRRAGVPLTFWECSDPAATIKASIKALNGKGESLAVVEWDCCNGFMPLTQAAQAWVANHGGLAYSTDALKALVADPPTTNTDAGDKVGGIVFMHNLQDFYSTDPTTRQALWNCRDALKAQGVNLVILGPAAELPASVRRDVVVLTEELPGADELADIAGSICKVASLDKPEGDAMVKVTDTLRGLSAFEAEQACALSISRESGIDLGALWERKQKTISQTPGLTISRPTVRFADIGGLDNAKELLGQTAASAKLRVSCIVFCDEIEKSNVGAAGGDLSGITADQNKAMLTYMQDYHILGALLLGPAGTGKSEFTKALAGEFGLPLIALDLGGLKNGIIGSSEANIRAALRVIQAVSDGRALFIGACNSTASLSPELRRRFNYQSLFFDLPNRQELDSIWTIKRRQFELRPDQCDAIRDDGWTGAEAHNCALKAWARDITLSKAAESIVPISRSAADVVQALRQSAAGKFTSASNPGLYQPATTAAVAGMRKLN